MQKIAVLAGLLVAIVSASSFGVGFMGPPTAELEQGQWNVGFNYMYSDMELNKTKVTESWSYLVEVPGFPDHTDSGVESFKIEIDDVKTQRYYGTIGYGVTDMWEAYFQLGIADLKARTKEAGDPEDDWSGFNFDNDFAWGWGTRYTFHEQDNCCWGVSVQMNWLDTSWDDKATFDDDVVDDVELDPGETLIADVHEEIQVDWDSYDLLIAVGPTVDMGGWSLYGGPFYYMLRGDIDSDITATLDGVVVPGDLAASGVITAKESGDLEVDSFGGFIGSQFTMMERYNMTTEFSFTGDGWAAGVGVYMPF